MIKIEWVMNWSRSPLISIRVNTKLLNDCTRYFWEYIWQMWANYWIFAHFLYIIYIFLKNDQKWPIYLNVWNQNWKSRKWWHTGPLLGWPQFVFCRICLFGSKSLNSFYFWLIRVYTDVWTLSATTGSTQSLQLWQHRHLGWI